MKKLIAVLMMAMAVNAYAGSAWLVSCNTGTSVTGRFVYIGTYEYYGKRFQQTFTSYCPYSIDVQ